MPNEDLNLVPAIRAIEGQISELKNEYVKKITPYKESLAKLKEINTACESCYGTGKVFMRSCAEDEGDYYTCPDCKGSGKCVTKSAHKLTAQTNLFIARIASTLCFPIVMENVQNAI